MFERFATETREITRRAAELAELEHSSTVEVEHLLLALVDPIADDVGRLLEAHEVDASAVREARDREFRSALAIAGVHTDRSAPPGAARLRRGRSTRFALSAKLALERTLEVALRSGEKRITNKHLLLAIVDAKTGIVPRLLDELGTSPDQLRQALDDE
ncbi:MAG: Clp protease N-terminal domain-containing protein [Microthrixaceae bacterium]